jgi:hypothetical protein
MREFQCPCLPISSLSLSLFFVPIIYFSLDVKIFFQTFVTSIVYIYIVYIEEFKVFYLFNWVKKE